MALADRIWTRSVHSTIFHVCSWSSYSASNLRWQKSSGFRTACQGELLSHPFWSWVLCCSHSWLPSLNWFVLRGLSSPLLLPEDSYFVRFLLSSWNPDPCLARGQEEVCFPGVVMSKCLLCGFLSAVIPKGLPVSLLFENELSYKYRSRKEAGSRG